MKISGNQVKFVIAYFHQELDSLYDKEEVDQFIYLCFNEYNNYSRADLNTKKEERLSESELLKYVFAVKDLKQHKPLQYILGYTWFYDLKITVSPAVLIPRPETEFLVHWLLDEIKPLNNPFIVDFCTGSGCIALAIKSKFKNAHVMALDVSEEALNVANNNAKTLELNVDFKLTNVLTDEVNKLFKPESLDVIISNPPYVKVSEKQLMQSNVLEYEPHLALFVNDDDALLFYRKIAKHANYLLKKNGFLFFEINEALGMETVDLLNREGFSNIELRKDLQGKNRMIKCTK